MTADQAFEIRTTAAPQSQSPGVTEPASHATAPVVLRLILLVGVAGGVAVNIAALAGSGHQRTALLTVGSTILGLALVVGVLAATGRARKTRTIAVSRSDQVWKSNCAFLGPFDSDGLTEAGPFAQRNSQLGNPPTGHLTLDGEGFCFRANFTHDVLSIPLRELRVVELVPGIVKFKAAVTAKNGWQIGQIRLTTTDGLTATFTGTPIDFLAERLQRYGGRVANDASS